MARRIYEVYAKIVDANGAYNTLSGYPKAFDSRNYNDDIEKTLRRARAEYYSTLGTMYTRDDRQLQSIILMQADGEIVEHAFIGGIDQGEEEILPDT